jgi:hypothetical protein
MQDIVTVEMARQEDLAEVGFGFSSLQIRPPATGNRLWRGSRRPPEGVFGVKVDRWHPDRY